ncbi:uncharacterized protein LOC113772385 [Coffea eugenioides]|uniref:uncharacterized protein LOC113772385 n=1 Tax=Coffea eugenioides TaxID=49369 RepID=UPI000F61538F|nr:uncharacterized protein LOC113772385 [Coffea eugenioides]
MGNCIVKESSTQWGGDDWGCLSTLPSEAQKTVFSGGAGQDNNRLYMKKKPTKMEEQSFLRGKQGAKSFPSSTTAGTEVKIKITKKQLEELLSKVDVQGKPVKEVLTQLLNLSDHGNETHHPSSWRPALQSIPEAEVY